VIIVFNINLLIFLSMSEKSNKTFGIILKVIIAVASAIAGALGFSSLS